LFSAPGDAIPAGKKGSGKAKSEKEKASPPELLVTNAHKYSLSMPNRRASMKQQ
jgi:hypothetical protein